MEVRDGADHSMDAVESMSFRNTKEACHWAEGGGTAVVSQTIQGKQELVDNWCLAIGRVVLEDNMTLDEPEDPLEAWLGHANVVPEPVVRHRWEDGSEPVLRFWDRRSLNTIAVCFGLLVESKGHEELPTGFSGGDQHRHVFFQFL